MVALYDAGQLDSDQWAGSTSIINPLPSEFIRSLGKSDCLSGLELLNGGCDRLSGTEQLYRLKVLVQVFAILLLSSLTPSFLINSYTGGHW
jgi:hypothetical protein